MLDLPGKNTSVTLFDNQARQERILLVLALGSCFLPLFYHLKFITPKVSSLSLNSLNYDTF